MSTLVFNNIMIGVVAGILSTILIQFFISLLKNSLIPLFRRLIYSGIRIDGKWDVKNFHKRATQEYIMELNQKADKVVGTVVSYKKHLDIERTDCEIFELTGCIRNRLFFGMMTPTDPNRLGQLCFIFDIIKDGSELNGQAVFYNTGLSRVTSTEMKLNRTYKKKD